MPLSDLSRFGRYLACLASFGLSIPSASAQTSPRGDTKQACAAAADRGQSLRDEGKYREAREALVRCSASDCPKIVSQACGGWLRDLDGATPTFVIGAQDPNGHDLTEVAVILDGVPITATLDGQPHAADPGTHLLRFEARDRAPVEQRLVLRSGEKNRLVMVTLAQAPSARAEPDVAPAAPETPARPGNRARVAVGLSLVALSVAAAAAGGYFVAQSIRESSQATDLRGALPSNSACAQGGSANCAALSDAVDAQHRDALLGGALLGGAGALALGAIATWVLWKPASDVDPQERGAWRVVPWIAPGRGVALGVTRSFP